MRTLAPGKVVLSGAYSVLDGAPAIVTAINRYVVVDTSLPGTFLTDEVKAAGFAEPLWFDASKLRQSGRKLGLGSSAAILLATLAARKLLLNPALSTSELRELLFLPALHAHQLAQGGGSGIDVACSCYGGTLEFRRGVRDPEITPVRLPDGLVVEVWASQHESSTKGLIAQVRALAERDGKRYRRAMMAQADASAAAVQACHANDPAAFITALNAQRVALSNLGREADAPIVTAEVEILASQATRLGAAVLPAGAGGGDIALFVGREPSLEMTPILFTQRHERLELQLGAEGLHEARCEC